MDVKRAKDFGLRILLSFGRLLVWVSALTFVLWSAGALFYFTLLPQWLNAIVALAYVVALAVLWFRVEKPTHWRAIAAGSIIAVYAITLIQQPSNVGNWAKDQAKLPSIEVKGSAVRIQNFRSTQFRSDEPDDVSYTEYAFDLQQIDSIWFTVQKFTALESMAHTFLSFGVTTPEGATYFGVSVEVRREGEELYNPVRGLYRAYEMMYVISDERDIVGARTNVRTEDRVHMYRVNATKEQARELFLDIAERVNGLTVQPEFYHTFLNNCTNSIVRHTYKFTPEPINWLDPRIVMPGYSDRFAFEKKLIGDFATESFESYKSRSRIDEIAREIGLSDSFSSDIRSRLEKQTTQEVSGEPGN